MPEIPPDEPALPITQPLAITSAQADSIAARLNADSYPDTYGNPWTGASVLAAHSEGTDEKTKRLILLLIIILLAIG